MVLVEDEAKVQRESDLKAIWYLQGVQPTIRVEQVKEAHSFYGALNVRSGKCHLKDFTWQTSKNTVIFLEALEHIYKGKDVLLIWDGAGHHRGEVKNYLKRKNKKWNLHIEYFPPYSPDLNPQEMVWKQGKANTAHNSEEEFQDKLYKFRQYIVKTKFKTNFLSKYS